MKIYDSYLEEAVITPKTPLVNNNKRLNIDDFFNAIKWFN